MSKLKVPQLLQQAEQHQKTGDLARMESVCREILAIRQDVPKVWYLLGVAARSAGRKDEAVDMLQKSLTLFPDSPGALADLGLTLVELGRVGEALPNLEKARNLQPNSADVCLAFGKALLEQKRPADAEKELQKALELNPRSHEAHLRIGNAQRMQARLDQALASYQAAIRVKSDYPDAYVNLGAALMELGRTEEAAAAFQQALQLQPKLLPARNNLGAALNQLGRFEEAATQLKAAVELDGTNAKAWNNLANALRACGSVDEALQAFQKSIELAPDHPTYSSNLVFALHYVPGVDPRQRLQAAKNWAARFADPLTAAAPPAANDRNPDRKLRIGYFSPDLRAAQLAFHLEPLLKNHDPAQVQLFAYTSSRSEPLIARLKPLLGTCREMGGLNDEAAASLIRQDGIDILVDLALHTNGNRLLTLARKPAPIIATWLNYFGSSGMRAVDFRLTDPFCDPQGADEFSSENLVRLPQTFATYDALGESPLAPPPCVANGFITFGSLHSPSKLNEPLAALWGAVLKTVPQSKLLIQVDGALRRRVAAWFAKQSLGDRVGFLDPPKTRLEQLALHAKLDISLDTFPFAGASTTLDALWMGVPVISLAGQEPQSRSGLSAAANLGLTDILIATNPQEFVQKAARLASKPDLLLKFRNQVRDQFQKSPLGDHARFARNLEAAYRQMWKQYCARK